jgi:hypothetical protein
MGTRRVPEKTSCATGGGDFTAKLKDRFLLFPPSHAGAPISREHHEFQRLLDSILYPSRMVRAPHQTVPISRLGLSETYRAAGHFLPEVARFHI